MTALRQDVRHAIRSLRRTPGLYVIVSLTLGLAVAGVTSIFSFLHAVLLQPLPYPDPDRLVMLCEVAPADSGEWCGASPRNLQDWQRESRSFEAMGLARNWPFEWRDEGERQAVRGGVATTDLFRVFAVEPALGRLFQPGDDRKGAARVAVVSHEFWTTRLGGDPRALGRVLELNGEVHEVVGVLPAAFEVPDLREADVWITLWPEGPPRADYRAWRGFRPFARLSPGVSRAAARAEMEPIRAALAAAYPETNANWGLSIERVHDRLVRGTRPALLAFQVAVLFVLLIACGNVANLLLARASGREREFAVRVALGAGRRRLARLLLVEAALFALGGAALGILLSFWTVELFRRLAPPSFPRLELVGFGAVSVVVAMIVALAASVLSGLLPAIHAGRRELTSALKVGRGSGGPRSGARLRHLLVSLQLALSLVLLVSAGLLVRSVHNLSGWRPGFDYRSVTAVQVFASTTKYPDGAQVTELYRRAIGELRTIPGVVAASAASAGPLFGGDGPQEYLVDGEPPPPDGYRPRALWYDVGADYFDVLGVPLVRGRRFSPQDGPESPRVAIVNETMARRLAADGDAVGRRVVLTAHEMTVEIVGVVADTRPFRPDEPTPAEVYWPFAQLPRHAIHLVMRSDTPQPALAPAVRARLNALDPDLRLGAFRTLEQMRDEELVTPRFNLGLLAALAALAVVLASIGIYGVATLAVTARARDIAVRLALGAPPRHVLRSELGRGLRLAAAGLGAGIVGALLLTRLLRSLLVGVAPDDPATLAASGAVLVALVLLASLVPARRAARVPPVEALRSE